MKDLEGILKRELYVSPPKEFKKKGFLMKMKKAAYGFADAPRRWFMTLRPIPEPFPKSIINTQLTDN